MFKLSLALLMLFSLPALANQVVNSDFHFLFGYQSFLRKDFSNCISEFNMVMEFTTKERIKSKAGLFKSVCQAKLGLKKESAYQAVRIKTKYLSSWDKRHYKRLKNYLNQDFNVALKERDMPKKPQYPLKYSFSPYAGQNHYPNPSQKRRMNFQGFLGSVSYHDYLFNVGYETSTLNGRSFPGFTQAQGHLAIQRTWKEFSLAGRYTNITSDSERQDGIQIYGLGSSYRVFEKTKLFADAYYSLYPESILGNLIVWQTHLGLEQVIYRTPEFIFWAKGGIQSTTPQSSKIRNGGSTIRDSAANRTYLDISLRFRQLTLTTGFWSGREVFGVRNNGTLVFSTPEEHLGGQSVALLWAINSKYSFNVLWMNENIRIDDIDSHARTTMGTLTYNFY